MKSANGKGIKTICFGTERKREVKKQNNTWFGASKKYGRKRLREGENAHEEESKCVCVRERGRESKRERVRERE